jgi:hypothetical protein
MSAMNCAEETVKLVGRAYLQTRLNQLSCNRPSADKLVQKARTTTLQTLPGKTCFDSRQLVKKEINAAMRPSRTMMKSVPA